MSAIRRFICLVLFSLTGLFACFYLLYYRNHSSTKLTQVPTHRYEYVLPQADVTHSVVNEEPVIMEQTEGFMVALKFWEQQTCGLQNFCQLQCLANLFRMRTAEPFVIDTTYTLQPLPSSSSIETRLGNLIDMDVWNRNMSIKYNCRPVVSWETLIREAPRNLIIHCIQYRQISPKTWEFNGSRNGCSEKCYKQFNSILPLLHKSGFKTVQRSCSNVLNLDLHDTIALEEFRKNIFGEYDPADVTVILNEFRGINFDLSSPGMRLPLSLDSPCIHINSPSIPNSQIIKDAEKYYRNKARNVTVGILVRIEKIHVSNHFKFEECANQAVQIKDDLYSKRGLLNTYLAMDVGKYGTRSIAQYRLRGKGQSLFNMLYEKEDLTFQEWEEMSTSIASSDNIAYVANVQRTIAAKAECLILIGGGSFQTQTRIWYEKFHPESSNHCIFWVCYS